MKRLCTNFGNNKGQSKGIQFKRFTVHKGYVHCVLLDICEITGKVKQGEQYYMIPRDWVSKWKEMVDDPTLDDAYAPNGISFFLFVIVVQRSMQLCFCVRITSC